MNNLNKIDFMEDNLVLRYFVKYGEEKHLQQIVDGALRFTPSQTYVKLEETQHNKGQGDLLEGKFKIKIESAKMFHPETDELLGVFPKSTLTISIQDVSNMPIFCLSHYGDEYIEEVDGEEKIVFDENHIQEIKCDFPKATHALIILEPEKFIGDVENIVGHEVVGDVIHYYDYDINSLQMYMFLTTGNTELKKDEMLTMTYDNRYRHLLCKDISFEKQREYRFIGIDELIEEPIFYSFDFSSRYMIVPIEQLKTPLSIN